MWKLCGLSAHLCLFATGACDRYEPTKLGQGKCDTHVTTVCFHTVFSGVQLSISLSEDEQLGEVGDNYRGHQTWHKRFTTQNISHYPYECQQSEKER